MGEVQPFVSDLWFKRDRPMEATIPREGGTRDRATLRLIGWDCLIVAFPACCTLSFSPHARHAARHED